MSSPGFESYLNFVKPDALAAALVAENSQLKRMYANLALENEAIKAVLKKL